jgi:hypothetical protein
LVGWLDFRGGLSEKLEEIGLGFELKSKKKKRLERRKDCQVLNHFKHVNNANDFFFISSSFLSKINNYVMHSLPIIN